MRTEFLKIVDQLEYEDQLFQEALSSKVMLDISLETWAVARAVAEKLHDLVLEYKPKQIIEVGTSLGYSTIWMAEAAREYGGNIITLEREPSKVKKTQKLFDELGYQEIITLIETDAKEFLKNYDAPVDFIFLDALKRQYVEYFKLAEKNLHVGSFLLADDVITWKRKVEDFLESIETSSKYKTQVFELGHGLLIAEKIS